MIKKSLFKRSKFPKLKTKEDFVLWLGFLKKGFKIYSLKTNLTRWNNTKNSLSSSVFQKLTDSLRVYHYYMGYNLIKSIYFTFILSINF